MTDNVERQLAAERRGWIFEHVGAAGASTLGASVSAARATLVEADEDDVRGRQFSGEGEDSLGDLLDKIEEFDRTNRRL
jgi:hypothetical protein